MLSYFKALGLVHEAGFPWRGNALPCKCGAGNNRLNLGRPIVGEIIRIDEALDYFFGQTPSTITQRTTAKAAIIHTGYEAATGLKADCAFGTPTAPRAEGRIARGC